MAKFVIAPHMRLQEWVAEEKGYFAGEGLDYEFRDQLTAPDGKKHDFGDKVGAFKSLHHLLLCNIGAYSPVRGNVVDFGTRPDQEIGEDLSRPLGPEQEYPFSRKVSSTYIIATII